MTGFFVCGSLPDTILCVLLVSVIEDNTGKMNSKENDRSLAFANILSEVLERILLISLKRQHDTDVCFRPYLHVL